jgi:hypothetical protein
VRLQSSPGRGEAAHQEDDRGSIQTVSLVTYVIDGHRVELAESADGEQWVCDCRAYRAAARASILGPRCSQAKGASGRYKPVRAALLLRKRRMSVADDVSIAEARP